MNKCFECEATEDLQEHHVVPKSRGGTKTVTLCYECHMKAHGRSGKGLNHKKLTKEALSNAKARGVKLGANNPKVLEGIRKKGQKTLDRLWPHIQKANSLGITSRSKIAKYLNERKVYNVSGNAWTRQNISSLIRRIRQALKEGRLHKEEI